MDSVKWLSSSQVVKWQNWVIPAACLNAEPVCWWWCSVPVWGGGGNFVVVAVLFHDKILFWLRVFFTVFVWGFMCVWVCACIFLCIYMCVCVCVLICVFAQPQGGDGYQHYKVRARLAVFNKRFKEAESIYLEGVSKKLHVCTSVIMLVLFRAVLCIRALALVMLVQMSVQVWSGDGGGHCLVWMWVTWKCVPLISNATVEHCFCCLCNVQFGLLLIWPMLILCLFLKRWDWFRLCLMNLNSRVWLQIQDHVVFASAHKHISTLTASAKQ